MFKHSCKWISCLAFSCSILVSCEKGVKKEFTNSEVKAELSGELSNGLKYFIRENPYDNNKASLRLAVKIGSVFEEEDERGLAHFLEHMVFRGTESYSDGEVVKYLESIGASFGADTNAYTSYDETVYMLEIPLEKEENLEKAFSILSEFAMKAKLSSEQLEIEKGVVLDELRLSESTSEGRISTMLMETLLQDTLYAERSPIGLEEVIKNCSQEKIRNFYSKWYRPENMAIIAVGNFSSEQAMTCVNRYFATLPTSECKIEYTRPDISSFKSSFAKTYKDPETLASYFILGSWLDNQPVYTKEDFKQTIVDYLVTAITNRRLEIKAESANPPFKMAQVSLVQHVHPATLFISQCTCWDQDPLKGLDSVLLESQKIRNQDFSQHEFDIAIAGYRSMLKIALENTNNHKNTEYAARYLKHFMYGGVFFSFEESSQIALEVLNQVELKDVNARKGFFFDQNQAVIYLPSEKSPEISEEAIVALASDRDRETFAGDNEEVKLLSLETSFENGSVLESQIFEETKVKKLTLSNGMKVYLEPSDLKENLFSLRLKASRGWDAYDASLFPSAQISCEYLKKSGLAGLSNLELKDAIAGKNVVINYYTDMTSRNIVGESSNEDMQIAFKMIHALFTDRTYREEAWNQQMKTTDEFFEIKDLNPEVRFYQLVQRLNYTNHYFFEFYNSKSLDKTNAETILSQIFSNPSEFTLVIAGDYNEKELILCLEKYLASIPSSDRYCPTQIVKEFEFPEGIQCSVLDNAGIGSESQVILTYPMKLSQFEGSYKDFYNITLAENVISTRLLKKLRSEAGETYGVSSHASFPFYPVMNSASFVIYFSSSPDMVDKMTTLLLEEVNKILVTPPTLEEKQKAIEIYKHQWAKNLQSNQGKVERISINLAFGVEPAYYLSGEPEDISSEALHEVMKSLFDIEHYTLCTKLPNKAS